MECTVLGVVEDEEIWVAWAAHPLSFLVMKGTDIILGRPFLFGFKAQLEFSPDREEVLTVQAANGDCFSTLICGDEREGWTLSIHSIEALSKMVDKGEDFLGR